MKYEVGAPLPKTVVRELVAPPAKAHRCGLPCHAFGCEKGGIPAPLSVAAGDYTFVRGDTDQRAEPEVWHGRPWSEMLVRQSDGHTFQRGDGGPWVPPAEKRFETGMRFSAGPGYPLGTVTVTAVEPPIMRLGVKALEFAFEGALRRAENAYDGLIWLGTMDPWVRGWRQWGRILASRGWRP